MQHECLAVVEVIFKVGMCMLCQGRAGGIGLAAPVLVLLRFWFPSTSVVQNVGSEYNLRKVFVNL